MIKPSLKISDATTPEFQKILELGLEAVKADNTSEDWRTIAKTFIENHSTFPAGAWVYVGGHHIAIILNQECHGQIVEF